VYSPYPRSKLAKAFFWVIIFGFPRNPHISPNLLPLTKPITE
jgi:hypothetical protein